MENKSISDVTELYKKNILTERTVIILLSGMILVLVAFIIGTQFINTQKYKSDIAPEATEVTTETEITTKVNQININSDNIIELCQIPGIGEAKARAIIEYRKENGDITDINELLDISGIGVKILENISPYIYIE